MAAEYTGSKDRRSSGTRLLRDWLQNELSTSNDNIFVQHEFDLAGLHDALNCAAKLIHEDLDDELEITVQRARRDGLGVTTDQVLANRLFSVSRNLSREAIEQLNEPEAIAQLQLAKAEIVWMVKETERITRHASISAMLHEEYPSERWIRTYVVSTRR